MKGSSICPTSWARVRPDRLRQADVTYDAYGLRRSKATIGGASYGEAYITDTYDAHTGKLTNQLVTNASSTAPDVDETTYDLRPRPATSPRSRSRRPGGPGRYQRQEETQCFVYSAPRPSCRTAWTATDACATTSDTSSDFAMVGNTLGTSSAYWDSWTYNDEGDRLTQDQHSRYRRPATTPTRRYTYSSQPAPPS